jgi:hypothetical protein
MEANNNKEGDMVGLKQIMVKKAEAKMVKNVGWMVANKSKEGCKFG